MSLTTLNSLLSTTYTLDAGDSLLVAQDGVLATPGNAIEADVVGDDLHVGLNGTVYSDAWAAKLYGAESIGFNVAASGDVYGYTAGVVIKASVDAAITNHGTISTANGPALSVHGTASDPDTRISVVNSGAISSASYGALELFSGAQTISFINTGQIVGTGTLTNSIGTSATAYVVNSGTISAGTALNFAGTGRYQVDNSGVLSGANGGIIGITGSHLSVTNSGQIEAAQFSAIVSNGGLDLANSGEITGGSNGSGVISQGASDIVNMGTITGDIQLIHGSNNAVQNAGTINGDIVFFTGDDLYDGRLGAVSGTVFGADGSDTLKGGALGEAFEGGTGDDVLRGRGGDDDLNGGDGNDIITGGRDDDAIVGGGGDDVMRGGSGDDRLTGGAGADEMYGGRDDDTFVFINIADMARTGATDHIYRFNKADDLIDLTLVAHDTLKFMGKKAFAGGGDASVSLKVAHGNTIVKIDADGDGSMDGRFFVHDATGLNAHHFLL